MKILIFFLVILIMLMCITLHELGHFIFAKKYKVNIKEFSIGVGPILFQKFQKKGAYYITFRLIPIIAYVMVDSHLVRQLHESDVGKKKYYFYLQPIKNDCILLEDSSFKNFILIMFGGLLFNLICFILFWIIIAIICLATKKTYSSFDPIKNLSATANALALNFILKGDGSIFSQIASIPGKDIGKYDWSMVFLSLICNLNLLLFILNILPFPPLDGFKMVNCTYTKISNKKINENFEFYLGILIITICIWSFISGFICDFKHASQLKLIFDYVQILF